jgi:hypothetical protein
MPFALIERLRELFKDSPQRGRELAFLGDGRSVPADSASGAVRLTVEKLTSSGRQTRSTWGSGGGL